MGELLTSGQGSPSAEDFVAAAATRDGKLLVAYVPPAHSGSVTIDMSIVGSDMHGRWFDPTNGKYTDIAGAPFRNDGPRTFSPPGVNSAGEGDWVLVLEAM